MRQVIITKNPVVLEGNQAILPKELIERLEDGRKEELRIQRSKLSHPERCNVSPAPWKKYNDDEYKTEFTWIKGKEPEIVDSEFKSLTKQVPTQTGTKVKLIFVQAGYNINEKQIIGTQLLLKGIQVIEASPDKI